MKVKRCYVCQQDKPLSAFHKNKTKMVNCIERRCNMIGNTDKVYAYL